jgi:hypothetical protein
LTSERSRHQLYQEVKEVLSVESADELMSYLPPVGWADVATKADLGMIRNEMDAQRAELRGEMSALRHELRSEFRVGMAELKTDLQRWTITTLIAMTGLFAGLVFAAVRFGQ